jgi:hypothetical protein
MATLYYPAAQLRLQALGHVPLVSPPALLELYVWVPYGA